VTDLDSGALLAEFDAAKITAQNLFKGCKDIPTGLELTQRAILEALGEPPYDVEFIKDNFSSLVSDLQLAAYGHYLQAEREVCGAKLAQYIKSQMTEASSENSLIAIQKSFFVLDRFYLSLTQSRRQRAGAAFEIVVQTLFRALGYPYTAQPELSGSRPDFVLPSIEHYHLFATDCMIFTCKRTLRERWRQVVTEGLSGQSFYLATIDEGISGPGLAQMKERNVMVVVPDTIKSNFYPTRLNVISFEQFFDHHLDPSVTRWKATQAI
jgi:EcoRII C terminal